MNYSEPLPSPRPSPWGLLAPFVLLILGVSLAAWAISAWSGASSWGTTTAAPRTVTPRGDLAADEKSTIELFKSAAPSVVYITTTQRAYRGFSRNPIDVPQGAGTGFVWDRRGFIVTNFHVIQNASTARVTLADGSTSDATLVGGAPDFDLAVLRIQVPPAKLPEIAVGSSKDLQVGQKVYAIGNPFGLDQTLTTGVISALGRSIKSLTGREIENVIQTDAAINPGNSGGPLLDSAGRLIGVNTQIVSPSGAYAGIGFAIPVDTVNFVVPAIIEKRKYRPPSLGITVWDETIARRLGIRRGVVVKDVLPNGAAAAAGIQPTDLAQDVLGDVIVKVDGQAVNTTSDLLKQLNRRKPGDTIRLTILRGAEELEVEAELTESAN